jgi:hypothetical protein
MWDMADRSMSRQTSPATARRDWARFVGMT